MKKVLKKPLGKSIGLALATGGVAAMAMMGSMSTVNAAVSANDLGDLAIVPYYTVRGDYITGVHITNTSNLTQVVKFRLRRDTDSADVLDFNIILSPQDVWTGYLSGDDTVVGSGSNLLLKTTDASCTAPASDSGTFTAPSINVAGADEGYIEIIGMASVAASSPVAVNALHAAGTPANCTKVRENFRTTNVINPRTTKDNAGNITNYGDTGNVLKVSYFVRDAASGMEFGNNAVHIEDFANTAMMSNQQDGLTNGSTNGFDYPNLDGGGAGTSAGGVGRYNAVIRADLGANSILNDWSFAASTHAATDWVVTVPGQYLMVSPDRNDLLGLNSAGTAIGGRRYTDLPLTAGITVYNREEGTAAPGQLVVSPSPAAATTIFPDEVNVVEWGGKSVFNSASPRKITDPGVGSDKGWAELTLASQTKTPLRIFDMSDTTGATFSAASGAVPVIGFTAWQRTFSSNANRNYGRIIEHSRK